MSKKPMPIATEQATQSASGKRYLDDFKRDAVRLVTQERQPFVCDPFHYAERRRLVRRGVAGRILTEVSQCFIRKFWIG